MMEKRRLLRMILSFILPPALVILLFTGAVIVYIIPRTEDALMQKKKDAVRSIVVATVSLLEKHAEMEREGAMTLAEAQRLALAETRALRYGTDNQDYIWITDQQPMMLMHPFYPEMEGDMLDRFTDSRGTFLFLEAAKITGRHGEGYIDYMWSKGRNAGEAVPKLSYVKLLKPWGWIVGSGIYLDDVQREIHGFTMQIITISGLIGSVVLLLLCFVVQRGWKSESGRLQAEEELIRSRERYQALAHASDEMIFLVIDGALAGANRKACANLEMKESELIGQQFAALLADPYARTLLEAMASGENAAPLETTIQGKSMRQRIMLTAEHAVVHNKSAILYTGKPLMPATQQESPAVIGDLVRHCGFGAVLLDSVQNGRITSADQTAESLLAGGAGPSVNGRNIQDLLLHADWQRMLVELVEGGRAERVRVGARDGRSLLAWAAVCQEERAARGQVAMLLLDDSVGERQRQAADALLTAAISPERLLSQTFLPVEEQPRRSAADLHFLHAATVIRLALRTGLHADRATAMATRAIDSIFTAAVARAMDTLGAPPCPFAFLTVGSIGRCEPTLGPDQDTAIIYAAGPDGGGREEYFRRLGESITAFAAAAGLPPCEAGNCAANPQWCLSDVAWHRLFTSYINASSPADLLKVNIFFDLRTVAGDAAMTERLRRQIFSMVAERPLFLFYLAKSTLEFRLPADRLGRLRGEGPAGNTVNLKGTMLHFVNFVRIYALQHGIFATNTIARLEALAAGRHLPPDIVRDTLRAWKWLLQMRLAAQAAAQEQNLAPRNSIFLEQIDLWDETMLKMAAAQVANLQRRLSMDFDARN